MATPVPGTGEEQDQFWPMPKYYFSVDIGDLTDIPFQDVTGIDIEADVIEYRHGNSPDHGTIIMPGIKKSGDITLKKGTFANDDLLIDQFSKISLNTCERITIVIRLLDETGTPRMSWTFNNAFPKQITGTDLNSTASEVSVESIVFSHHGFTQEV